MKVKLKKEIVTLGRPGVRSAERAGQRVEPAQWNRLITDPAVVLIDTRNQYEHQIGTFENARSPGTVNFREFLDYARVALDARRDKKVAMFCTGGIRCEKASAYLLQQGFEAVYQLKGGILNYLAEVEARDSLWRGECFVFDARVSVDHKLARGRYEQCFACRRPLSAADRRSAHYRPGVSCARCIGETTAARRAAFSERQRQMELAAGRPSVYGCVPGSAGVFGNSTCTQSSTQNGSIPRCVKSKQRSALVAAASGIRRRTGASSVVPCRSTAAASGRDAASGPLQSPRYTFNSPCVVAGGLCLILSMAAPISKLNGNCPTEADSEAPGTMSTSRIR